MKICIPTETDQGLEAAEDNDRHGRDNDRHAELAVLGRLPLHQVVTCGIAGHPRKL